MNPSRTPFILAASLALACAAAAQSAEQDSRRFHTDRESPITLPLFSRVVRSATSACQTGPPAGPHTSPPNP